MRLISLFVGGTCLALAACGGDKDGDDDKGSSGKKAKGADAKIEQSCMTMMAKAVEAEPADAPSQDEQKQFCGVLVRKFRRPLR